MPRAQDRARSARSRKNGAQDAEYRNQNNGSETG